MIFAIQNWMRINLNFFKDNSDLWMSLRINTRDLSKRVKFAFKVSVPNITPSSVLGFLLLILFISQYLSGFLLSLMYNGDPSFIVVIREELVTEVW